MRDIAEYKVIHARDIDALHLAMASAIKDGWQPYGDLHMPTLWWSAFTQVVVKYR